MIDRRSSRQGRLFRSIFSHRSKVFLTCYAATLHRIEFCTFSTCASIDTRCAHLKCVNAVLVRFTALVQLGRRAANITAKLLASRTCCRNTPYIAFLLSNSHTLHFPLRTSPPSHLQRLSLHTSGSAHAETHSASRVLGAALIFFFCLLNITKHQVCTLR